MAFFDAMLMRGVEKKHWSW